MKSKRSLLFKFICMLLSFALFIPACGNDASEAAVSYISEKYGVPGDNQLIVYTSHKEEVYLPIIQEFENVTGIRVTIHAGGTTELFNELKTASKEGKCDIMFGGGTESFEAAKDCFMPYASAYKDCLDEAFLSDGDYWTPFTELPLVFIYNNKLLSASEAPASWDDLLSEKWRGRIAFADLHKSGTSYTILSTIMQLTGRGADEVIPEFLDLLDGKILESSGQIVQNVSDGNFLVGVTLEETAKKKILAGYDIAMVYPSDGTSAVPDGIGIVKNAPHSYNAGRFVDFVVDIATQQYAIEQFKRRPVRSDISLPEEFGEIKRMDFDISESANNEDKVFALWDELVAEGSHE